MGASLSEQRTEILDASANIGLRADTLPRGSLLQFDLMVARGGIEPPTRGFSVRYRPFRQLINQPFAALAPPRPKLTTAQSRHSKFELVAHRDEAVHSGNSPATTIRSASGMASGRLLLARKLDERTVSWCSRQSACTDSESDAVRRHIFPRDFQVVPSRRK